MKSSLQPAREDIQKTLCIGLLVISNLMAERLNDSCRTSRLGSMRSLKNDLGVGILAELF